MGPWACPCICICLALPVDNKKHNFYYLGGGTQLPPKNDGFLISPVIFWQLAPGTHRGMSGLFNIIVNSVNFDLIDPLDATQEFTGG